jgi:hypothetical protein
MKYTLTLAHGPNEDVEGGYWRTPNAPPMAFINVNSLREAKELFEAWRDDNGLGSGNMTLVSGIVSTFPAGGFIGQFSYNGRLWDAPELAKTRHEISETFIDKYGADEIIPHYDDGRDI